MSDLPDLANLDYVDRVNRAAVELSGHGTRITLSGVPWQRGITRLTLEDRSAGTSLPTGEGRVEIPFLLPALAGHHFFTGVWPPAMGASTHEPQESPGRLVQQAQTRAVLHQQPTRHMGVETQVSYEIVGPGTVDASFQTRSHATAYPHGSVGLFWATVVPPGGQRGMHVLLRREHNQHGQHESREVPRIPHASPVEAAGTPVEWHYFAGGGDCWSCAANTMLGPRMTSAPHDPDHPPTYYFAEAPVRFALPLFVVRWHDLYYSVAVDTDDVAFTNVLCATAIGGPSHDLYWRLRPGQTRTVRCRLTVGRWPGWEAVEERYRAWSGCINTGFLVHRIAAASPTLPHRTAPEPFEPLARPQAYDLPPTSGLALSQRLFETRGREVLDRLGLLERCAVGCFGGTSQNARVDDASSRDHAWGPHLTFVLPDDADTAIETALREAVEAMPDEVNGVRWIGYGGPQPRRTGVRRALPLLRDLTGFSQRPAGDTDWLPYLGEASFLGRRWTERMFDAGQGAVFHDPGKRFTEQWRHWTGYPPPDVHRALLARSLFRTWNAGPEYNLARTLHRGDRLAFAQCLARFVDEVVELAFCWNERYVPAFKWRAAHFRRLPIVPTTVREELETIHALEDAHAQLASAERVVASIKRLLGELYHLTPPSFAYRGSGQDRLSFLAHAVRATISDEAVRRHASLDW